VSDAQKAAAKIRDHIENKTPSPCDPTFMDGEGWWQQIRYWPDLGLARHDRGPSGKRSKEPRVRYWAHNLLPDAYDTLDALLAALDRDA
jgi:hypothetical protein